MQYSVVIPAYNAATLIGASLDSVLAQTVPPERVIVIDDGSTDDTVGFVGRYGRGVEIQTQPNTGPGSATQRGFHSVRTPIVATVDSDDLWQPDKMERQLALLAAEPQLDGVFGQVAEFRDNPASADLTRAYDGWLRSTMTVRIEATALTAPMIDPPGIIGELVDWIARMREAGARFHMMPEVVTLRRVHAASTSFARRSELGKSYLQIARATMLRRRAREGGKQ
ncbi:MAG: glycosyltransferase [Devosia sp.]